MVILIVGSVEPQLLGTVAHLKAYTPADYKLVAEFVSRFRVVAVTPQVLTEVAHFVGKIGGRYSAHIRVRFIELVTILRERPVPTRRAVDRKEFAGLDLADCTLLEAAGSDDILLSTDAQLVLERLTRGLPAINFNRLREAAGIL
ncbi:MAG TPA: hypothetical protein VE078_18400 [Thermoanaerobaculia bacterium]|nr:hypothetical protein [Thermoanaerobaculia bacterium]